MLTRRDPNLECREGSSEVCAYPQAQALGGCEKDPRILESDEWLRYYIPEGQWSRADGLRGRRLCPKDTKRKSVSGVAVMCGGTAIQWISRTQKCTTLSSSETEYVAMAEGFKEALFLRHVWRFLLPDFGDPCIQIFEDNKGAIQMAVNPVTKSNSKHIDVRHHFLREHVENGEFKISHVESKYQHADFSTKPLAKDAFRFHTNFIMNMS